MQLATVSLTHSLIAIHYRVDTLADTLMTQLIQSYRNLRKGKPVLVLRLEQLVTDERVATSITILTYYYRYQQY